jgi:hypothetical protein
MEAASELVVQKSSQEDGIDANATDENSRHHVDYQVHNVYFQFFTSGLGGSGPINLFITNLVFGEPMTLFQSGRRKAWLDLSGRLLGLVDFGSSLVGRRQVFAWPFPEAATVPEALNATGDSIAAMGTAPDIWNTMLGALVNVIPRSWWKSKRFSRFMADFSQPLVYLCDAYYLKGMDKSFGTGETHAMRVDVTRRDQSGISITQGHQSFRQCVGQSCAEFALDCLQHGDPGVYLPEQRYQEDTARRRVIDKLTTTPGTFCYSGPLAMEKIVGPSELDKTIRRQNKR